MNDVILRTKTLSSSAYEHVVAVPLEKVDIADWLFTLPEAPSTVRARPLARVCCSARHAQAVLRWRLR
jgi:hypothetical protein